jgi:inorganic pyrophosphatase
VHDITHNLLFLPLETPVPNEVNAVIEIPSGSRNKIEYDKKLGIFRLDRVLHSPMHYPGDYGFLPRTLGDDGDPLDVVVLVMQPTFSGCMMAVRPIGFLKMIDEGKADEKILAVPNGEPEYAGVTNYQDIAPHRLLLIQHFFETYKLLEGKHTSSAGWGNLEEARQVIARGAKRFHEAHTLMPVAS